MSWDKAYKQLVEELGRKPRTSEVQERMFEIARREQKRDNNSTVWSQGQVSDARIQGN